MDKKRRCDLAQALLHHLRAGHTSEVTFWGWEAVQHLIDSGDLEAWDVIAEALAEPLTPREIRLIGAGVFEELMVSHGEAIIGLVEAEAERNPRIIEALRAVNSEDLPASVISRLNRLLGR